MTHFEPEDFWKAIVLYGLNQATYKIALAKALLSLCGQEATRVAWSDLSKTFLDLYLERLQVDEPMPQQSNPARRTRMERIVFDHVAGRLSLEAAIDQVGITAFGDVIPRFHNLAQYQLIDGMFYRVDFGHVIELTDELHYMAAERKAELNDELDARWSLLEGAFAIRQKHYQFGNDLRQTYLEKGYSRTPLTDNIPFLQGYQGNTCFYCGEPMVLSDVHVDHVLPRQVLRHDEIWNLVLSHSFCNQEKADKLVGPHYMQKLHARNENIVGSNHPWKEKVKVSLGRTPARRLSTLDQHYARVREILGRYYWGGSPGYRPDGDSFYQRLVTILNNS